MLKGERVCGVLLEYQKPQSRAILTTHYGTHMMQVMAQATEEILTTHRAPRYLVNVLKRASTTGSRILAGRKLCLA
jgi:hypothetical protein